MDIKLLIEPRGSKSPASKKSATYVYTTAPVLPALSDLQRHPHTDQLQHPQAFRPLLTGTSSFSAPASHPPLVPGPNESPPSQLIKRAASQTPHPEESPAKKQSKWTTEEDNLTIDLRGQGMKWDDIAKRLPGRSAISCRLRYQNYLEKRAIWDDEKKNKLAQLYARFKEQMWNNLATEMNIPWRSAESMHWQLGEPEMNARANTPLFQLHPSALGITLAPSVPSVAAPHGFTPANAGQLAPTLQPPQPPSQQHQQLLPGPVQPYHHRPEPSSGQSCQRNSSISQRRGESSKPRVSAPPQSEPPYPLQPASGNNKMSETRTVLPSAPPAPEGHTILKREGDSPYFAKPRYKRRRKDEGLSGSCCRSPDNRSQDTRNLDPPSQHSMSGSVRSVRSARSVRKDGDDHDRLKEAELVTL
ncbi:hypothetical protein GQ43DRAFT_277981 [Delitschia confertaspora ATCC 74209]|uniref:Myb-like DNA-binding domain protein n=1 Tax=Delitschia confertaspora ATCC 74209 TaxID=1513339 RepID=A0A9P4MKM0_9PLEO|nr:hypothetical protein GQ43DRAFT_277981 [Delitschia confertaspora ATCC 74209]